MRQLALDFRVERVHLVADVTLFGKQLASAAVEKGIRKALEKQLLTRHFTSKCQAGRALRLFDRNGKALGFRCSGVP